MNSYTLQENVVSENKLHVAEEGKVFKGGYKAIIEEYYFLNPWTDRREIKRFKKRETMNRYLSKKYPTFEQI
jgi:hypothetical protein